MSDTDDADVPAWIADGTTRDDPRSAAPALEVIPDDDSNSVTFVHPDRDDPTTAWITVDADLVVDVGDYH
jgi:hypothetical protein